MYCSAVILAVIAALLDADEASHYRNMKACADSNGNSYGDKALSNEAMLCHAASPSESCGCTDSAGDCWVHSLRAG
jgi:hypothetical protein